MMSKLLGIIPCAGTATRLYGLPKFMLPLKNKNKCLLSEWIDKLIELGCDKIIIGASPVNITLIENIKFGTHSQNILFLENVGITDTMNETVNKILKNETYETAIMAMPDTYVDHISHKLLEALKNSTTKVGAYLWNIHQPQIGKIGQCKVGHDFLIDIKDKDINCDYKYGWGVIIFDPLFQEYILNKDSHLGYSMSKYLEDDKNILYEVCNGEYFDCGTVTGYSSYLIGTNEQNIEDLKNKIANQSKEIYDLKRRNEELSYDPSI